MSKTWLFFMLGICVLALLYVVYNYVKIKKMKEGNARMVKMSAIIRKGSEVFLKKEFVTIAIVILIVAALFSLFIEKFSGLTYILGALMSSVVCILGMKSATYANVRTANIAKETLSIGKTVKVALAGGVAANKGLRSAMQEAMDNLNIKLTVPQFKYCTDNAAMIASRRLISRSDRLSKVEQKSISGTRTGS